MRRYARFAIGLGSGKVELAAAGWREMGARVGAGLRLWSLYYCTYSTPR